MKNIRIIGVIGIIVLVFIGIILISKRNNNSLKLIDLNDLSLTEQVSLLENSINEADISYAAIYGDKLVYGNNVNEKVIPLSEDEFYLSFAPYINHTHPCSIHNLITCRGELKNGTFYVIVKNNAGEVIKEGKYKTYNNGFAGIWLPKNMEGTITVTYGKLSATTNISTYSDSNTCLTTLKLV